MNNSIAVVRSEAFTSQPSLERIDLRYNRISTIDGGAFGGLTSPKEIYLAGNRLILLNSDVFEGASSLEKLDLSENFISAFPSIALQEVGNLKLLNLSSNMIQKLESAHLENLKGLQILDLSRNGINSVAPATFRDLSQLKYLDLSLNSLRTIEDDALEGLDSLQTLILRDNNILLIPGSALGRLPRLSNLYLDYNRVAALSSDILGSIQPEDIKYMSLSRNVIRELPPGSFEMFRNLRYLDLSGNSLATISADTFQGLDSALRELRVSHNRITSIGNIPLALRKLRILDLSDNNIVDIAKNSLMGLENLLYLNLSHNHHLGPIPVNLLQPLVKLRTIDLSMSGLKTLPSEVFENSPDLEIIVLRNNAIQEIGESTFANLRNISSIDLSHNHISSLRSASFVNLMNLKKLNLKGNQLSAFKGEFFNTGTGLEELDLSDNQLSYLFPSSFRIHPRLRRLSIANNKFNFFPSELIATLQYLEHINLSGNELKTIDELDFARLPRLRVLDVAYNQLETLSEMAFHNSTQLQVVDLSNNRIDRIGERTFEGLVRLETLNLEGNRLNDLPETIFDRAKLHMLENINLANNKFDYAPLKALQRQYFFVTSVNLSKNNIKSIPSEDSVMVNIKKLDLSYNPLTEQTVENILNEPKTVRELNLAGTGVKAITSLETPFLQSLNLSHNNIVSVNEEAFERATLLESLDLSSNMLNDIKKLSKMWPKLTSLQYLDLSNNSFEIISQGDFDNLDMLKSLAITDLNQINRIEKNAFKNLPNLSELKAYNYPRLGYLDVQGIVELLPTLSSLDVEIKDAAVGSDQIQPAKHPRLKELGIRGSRLRSISAATLAGLKGKDLHIKLMNTSLSVLPPALLFPVPRSSNVDLDVSGSKLTVLSPQLLTALEDRRNSLSLHGLDSNPIHCDCNARALRRWLPGSHMSSLRCATPDYLAGKLLTEVGDDELTCDSRKPTTATPITTKTTAQRTTSKIVTRYTTSEPEIIWSMPPSQAPTKIKTKPPMINKAVIANDDTLIIIIVGSVVAFITILIIIICIVRLRMSSNSYHNGPIPMGMPPMPLSSNMQIAGYKTPTPLYAIPPYAQNYATLPHKPMSHQSMTNLSQSRTNYSTMGRNPYYHQSPSLNGQPFVIYSDEKSYR
ncbi:transforming growth factor beta activator LRRC32 isoform X2 [Sitodiplosis mosellana]|nr:transforming growth factor beta activator LRRC32 isoform X2 [Sitodiplosis mosellana]